MVCVVRVCVCVWWLNVFVCVVCQLLHDVVWFVCHVCVLLCAIVVWMRVIR